MSGPKQKIFLCSLSLLADGFNTLQELTIGLHIYTEFEKSIVFGLKMRILDHDFVYHRFPRDIGVNKIDSDLIDMDSDTITEGGSFRDGLSSAFTLVLFTEIADKTFFVACIMAMRYNRLVVFAGAWGALVLMTFLSCVVGHVVTSQAWLSTSVTHYIAASLFLIFAIQMLYEGYKNRDNSANEEMEEVAAELREDDEELRVRFRKDSTSDIRDVDNPEMVVEILRISDNTTSLVSESTRNRSGVDAAEPNDEENEKLSCMKKIEKFLTIFVNPVFLKAFVLTFIAEWGDRSQISTVVLAVSTDKTAVFFGGIMGHFCCTMAAIIFGRLIANRIKLIYLNIAGGLIFIAFSAYTFYLAATGEND